MTDNSRQQTADSRGGSSRADAGRAQYSFRELAVWQKAQELSLLVVDVVRHLPQDRASAVLGQQVLRSATSIAANIAEGHGRYASGAYRNHLSIARGSANETLSWVDLRARAHYIDSGRESELLVLCDEVLKMVSAQMIAIDRRSATRGAR